MDPREEKLRELARLCGELGPDDGRDPRLERRAGSRKKSLYRSLHKARQLCAEARRTIEVALAGSHDPTLRALVVRTVEPAPDASHLLVVVAPGEGAETTEDAALAALRGAASGLREEVAAAIVRRRAPELTFRVLPRDGGGA